MERIDALKALLSKVESGELDWPYCAVQHVHGIGMNETMWRAYEGSLDAAKALHEAVFPGWRWEKPSRTWEPNSVGVISPHWQEASDGYEDGGYQVFAGSAVDNPARAWLIAILKALISEEEK